jgi:hypothetical protein
MNKELNDITNIQTSINSTDSLLTEDLVADYLQENPEFF